MNITPHDRIIYRLAWQRYRLSAGFVELDDLIAEGRVAELRATRDHDASKGAALSTLVYTYAQRAMLDYTRAQVRNTCTGTMPEEVGAQEERPYSVLHDLTGEAREVAAMIFNAPDEFLELSGERAGAGMGWSEFCKALAPRTGFTWSTLQRVYQEIRDVLGQPL